jgi:spoIIIJ-associated protein
MAGASFEPEKVIKHILDFLGVSATVAEHEEDEYLVYEISCPQPSVLIGHDGATLDALQHIVAVIVNTHRTEYLRINLDVEGYHKRQLEEVEQEARHIAHSVLESGRPRVLPPMDAAKRRAVHMVVQTFGTLTTESIGIGHSRRVVIKPKTEKDSSE